MIICRKISTTSLKCYNSDDATNFNEKKSVEKLTSSNIPMPNSFPLVIIVFTRKFLAIKI